MNDNNESNKVVGLNGKPIETDQPLDKGQRFEITLSPAFYEEKFTMDGFLGVTPAFVAIANVANQVVFAVPSGNYIYIKSLGRVEDLDAQKET